MKKLSWYLGVAALLVGLVEVSLRLWSFDFESGLRSVHNDPGKCLFHIFVLPPVIFLMCRLPVATVMFFRALKRSWFLCIGSSLMLVATAWFTYDQARSAFFTSCATPEDLPMSVGDSMPRREYRDMRIRLRDGVASASADKRLDAAASARQAAYKFAATLLVKGSQKGDVEAETWAAYFRLAGLRRHVADVLALIGNITAVWLFLAIAARGLSGGRRGLQRITSQEKRSLLVPLACLSTWLPMRAYSEWYHQFGSADVSYVPICISQFFYE